jgi:UDP-N-acetylmuramoyl-L-alanyl-D-glutamate--2,6-diaminopimelate ligase
MRLSRLISSAGIQAKQVGGDPQVRGLQHDSRRVAPGQLFALLPSASGKHLNSQAMAQEAKQRGAVAFMAPQGQRLPAGFPVLRVTQPLRDYGLLCAAFYGWPARRLKVAGVTGTNGKTTTSFLLGGIFRAAGQEPAVLGTVGYYIGGRRIPAPNTTPSALELQSLLRRALRAGCQAVSMEVSSHALALDRVAGIGFDAAIFTNLTRDHLDFHGTMAAYRQAKGRLFSQLRGEAPCAAINLDDPAAAYMIRRARAQSAHLLTYGLSRKAAVRAISPVFKADGTRCMLALPGAKPFALRLPLPGRFNLSNGLAAAAAAWGLGLDRAAIAAGLEAPLVPPGRFERVEAGQAFSVIVDYAHTPDALQRVLEAAREFTRGRIIVVFGCGGDLDRGKRPQMGRLAYALADLVVLTSDNPRSEDPASILAQIRAGIPEGPGDVRRVLCMEDRAAAIRRAIKLARKGDTVLVAGKGHEDYQLINGRKRAFDDRLVCRAALQEFASC